MKKYDQQTLKRETDRNDQKRLVNRQKRLVNQWKRVETTGKQIETESYKYTNR